MTPNKQKLIERLLSGSDDLFSSFVIAGLEESLEIICEEVKRILSMDKIPDYRMDDLIHLRADGEATIRILKYYGAGSYPVASDLMAQAHIRIQAWECYLRATEQPDMSQEGDTEGQFIPALKEAQERTKGLLTEDENKRLHQAVRYANDWESAADEARKESVAKLAKAVEALEKIAQHDTQALALNTLSELKGDRDD